ARVVILTGAGGHFCSGGDVKTMRTRHTAAEGRGRVELLNRLVLRLVSFPLPTIAMVDGYAVGAGSNLALCCDLIVASDPAKIAAGPPLALRLDKQMLNRAVATDLGGALEAEASSQGLAIASDDHREGVAAFFDKRPPKFTGR